MKSSRFHKSLVKNWPGGRRNATVIKEDGHSSYLVFNHIITGFKKPYLPIPAPEPASDPVAEGQLSS